MRDGHDYMRRTGAIDVLTKTINRAQDRNGIGPGMEWQMPASWREARGSRVTRVDEPNDRRADPWTTQTADQPPRIAPRTNQDDPGLADELRAGTPVGPDAVDPRTYHPWRTSLESVFSQALRSTDTEADFASFGPAELKRPLQSRR